MEDRMARRASAAGLSGEAGADAVRTHELLRRQKRFNLLRELLVGDFRPMSQHPLSGGIVYESQRHLARPLLQHGLIEGLILRVREVDRERRLLLRQELLDLLYFLWGVQCDGKEVQPLVAILLVDLRDGWKLPHTRRTPTRPEVDHDDLALALVDQAADLLCGHPANLWCWGGFGRLRRSRAGLLRRRARSDISVTAT